MKSTLKNIAEEAGVSISTVSRIINDDPKKPASSRTRKRVLQIAERLEYLPNLEARLLKNTGKDVISKTIGCILTSRFDSYNDPFFSSILAGVKAEAFSNGYSVGFTFSYFEYGNDFPEQLAAYKFDGIVLMGRVFDSQLELIRRTTANIVYAGLNRINRGFDEVISDAYDATKTAMNYLLSLNHRKIGFLGSIPVEHCDCCVINEHRYRAYCDTLALSNIAVNSGFVRSIQLNAGDGYTAMSEIIESNMIPSAMFCANDLVAMGAIRAIRENNIDIPGDISVIGIDNINLSEYLHPPLTTINVPKEELGRFAAKLLIDRIKTNRTIPCCVTLPFNLVERLSCKAI